MKLGLVQMMAAPMEAYEETAQRILRLTEQACEQGAQLVLLPECAYPAYMIGRDPERRFLQRLPSLLEELGQLARRRGVYVVMGAALPGEDGTLENGAVALGPDGTQLGRAAKSNLWHFDGRWFTAGRTSFLFDTPYGRMGVMICADGRIPEIARMLRLQGAQMILDTVNLVASAAAPAQLSNQQYQFILPIRAWENGVPIAVCDKAGPESGAVCCLGRSFIASAEGEIVAQCSPDKEEILVWDVEPAEPLPLQGRRPELYGALCNGHTPRPQLPRDPADAELFAALVRFEADTPREYVEKACGALELCRMMDARLMVLPAARGFALSPEDTAALCAALGEGDVAVADWGQGPERGAHVLRHTGEADRLLPTHLPGADSPIRTAELWPGCRAAAVFDGEMAVPELARVAMLEGADLVLWFDAQGGTPDFALAQTRAAENKMFVLRSGPAGEKGRSYAVSPDGAQLFTTFFTAEQIGAGMVNLALSKCKTVVPGTHILDGRIPDFYKSMTE